MSEQLPPADHPPEQPQQPGQSPTPHSVPPGYPPPYGVPPGYAPPPGYGPAMPPPGYGVSQPPPAGYPAYSQGAYYPPAFTVPPPRDYATPPDFPGQPWRVASPAEGSLLQAWFSVATKLTRQNIAAWAQASKRGWTAWSIAVYLTFVTLPFLAFAIAGAIVGPSIVQNLFTTNGQTISANDLNSLQNGFIIGAVVVAIALPLLGLAAIYGSTFFWALFMPPSLGTLGARMQRAIKPYALILPASSLVSLLTLVIAGGVVALIGGSTHFITTTTSAGTTVTTPDFSGFFLGTLLFDAFSLLLSIYTYSLLLQAGSVGTTLSRIAVFGIQLLAGLVYGTVFVVIFVVAGIILGTAISANVHSSGLIMPLLQALAQASRSLA